MGKKVSYGIDETSQLKGSMGNSLKFGEIQNLHLQCLEGGLMTMERVFDNFLKAYWLRPETAMWRTLDVKSMECFRFKSPSLDIGCGDGTFSFIRAGGEFEDSFDVFQVGNLEGFFDNIDCYDVYAKNEVIVKREPSYTINVGLDHKDTLVQKAGKLGLYEDFVVADANEKLPFADNSFNTVFSNIIYWLNDPEHVFREIYRVLRVGGECCVMLPGTAFANSSFYYKYYIRGKREEFAFLKYLDRGRFEDNIKIVKDYEEWKCTIEKSGLKIKKVVPHLSSVLISIWDIGLRPLFPILKKMTDKLLENDRNEMKKEWNQIVKQFAWPIVVNDKKMSRDEEFCFYCFILEK